LAEVHKKRRQNEMTSGGGRGEKNERCRSPSVEMCEKRRNQEKARPPAGEKELRVYKRKETKMKGAKSAYKCISRGTGEKGEKDKESEKKSQGLNDR